RRRRLRPQRDAPPTLVLEREHLLADDVGRASDTAGEELGVLEHRRLDPPVPGALEQLPGRPLDACPRRRVLRQGVGGAAWGLEPLVHSARAYLLTERPALPGELGQEGIGGALGTERRDAHVPGIDRGLL